MERRVNVFLLISVAILLTSVVPLVSAWTFFISSPNVFRVGVDESILVSLLDPPNVEVQVRVSLKRTSESADGFVSTDVTLRPDSAVVKTTLRVEPANLARNEGQFQHMWLTAKSLRADYPFQKEERVLVTLQSGYVFVQTDKPIYTPNQNVIAHVISLDQNMQPSDRQLHVEMINPKGISFFRFKETVATNGFLTGEYTFPQHPMLGEWSVVAFYGPEFQLNSTVKFEVKEYVLPTFSVKVRPPNYILQGQNHVSTEIDAQYVFGKPVIGRYLFKFNLVDEHGEQQLPPQERRGSLDNHGRATVTLTGLDALFGANWFDLYDGYRFQAEAIVFETSTGFSEKGENTTAKVVTSPYTFSARRTMQYFKKALTMHLKFDLTFANGQPASGIPVPVQASALLQGGNEQALHGQDGDGNRQPVISNTDERGRRDILVSVPPDAITIQVQISTQDPNYAAENQASLSFEIPASDSPNGEYIVIVSEESNSLTVGQEASIIIQRSGQRIGVDLQYLCVTAGKIVSHGHLPNVGNNPVLHLPVTTDMIPSTRLIVYYVTDDGHVIADAQRLDVEERCSQEVSLSLHPPREPPLPTTYLPHQRVEVAVHGSSGSKVGLLAVDKAVYLLRNKDRLTRRKMFDRMKSYDMGCGPGGGLHTDQIFKDSGMTVLTNAGLDVSTREEMECEASFSRRRRSIDEAALHNCITENPNLVSCLESRRSLTNAVQRPNWSCSRRATVLYRNCEISEVEKENYLACCYSQLTITGRSNVGDDPPEIDGDVQVRSDFRETWFFELLNIPNDTNEVRHIVHTPSSITEWKMTAVSVSPHLGMCIHDTTSLTVFQTFFIQLHLPYSVVRLEQTQIVVTVFNYGFEPLEINVYFTTPEGLCSVGRPGEPYSRTILVNAQNANTTTFVVLPVDVGEFLIRVSAGPGRLAHDIVEKKLRVVAQGVTKRVVRSVTLNPGKVMFDAESDPTTQAPQDVIGGSRSTFENKRQINRFNLSLPEEFIPKTESCNVNMIGNLLGTIVTDPINGLEHLVRQPTGCGEQTMIRLGPTLFVYKYLRSVGLDTPQLEARVYDFLADGIQRELTFRHNDGSYAAWLGIPGSTWLTAFVVKVFSQASEFTRVESGHVQESLYWLIDRGRSLDGAFVENQHVYHQEMIGAVKGDISMTAYVLISLLESRGLLIPANEKIDNAITRAANYLVEQIPNTVRVYDKAIVAYALTLAQSDSADEANDRLKMSAIVDQDSGSIHWDPNPQNYDGNRPYWLTRRPSAISVETTAYGLLTQMLRRDYNYAGRVAIWLSGQQNYQGGFVSTQDTIVALQALANYTERPTFSNIELECHVQYDKDPSFDSGHVFDSSNARVVQEVDMTPAIGSSMTLRSSGVGVAKANVELRYNSEESDENTCPFNLNVTAAEIKNTNNDVTHIDISVCARYTNTERSTHMSIIDVGLYTGFNAVENDLQEIVNGSDLVSSYERSDRSVIFYLIKIPNDEVVCVNFTAAKGAIIGNTQPVPVHVYDYYDPEESCTKFYMPSEGSSLLSTLCADNECVCARQTCGECGQRHEASVLENAACSSEEGYALRVFVDFVEEKSGFQIINVTVKVPIKTGVDNVGNEEHRQMYVDAACSCPRFQAQKTYLVVGHKGLKFTMANGQEGFKYLLDDQALVEFWPPRPPNGVVPKPRRRIAINKLTEFQRTMTMRGCRL